MATVYRSKIDGWLIVVLGTTVVTSLLASFAILASGTSADFIIAAFTVIIGCGLPLWLLISTCYTLGHGQLVVRSGPFKWCIPVVDITPTSSALSSPALSLDRLHIEYGQGNSLMISPCNQEQFVRDIEAATRDLA